MSGNPDNSAAIAVHHDTRRHSHRHCIPKEVPSRKTQAIVFIAHNAFPRGIGRELARQVLRTLRMG
jgi:hypothetical protein